MISEAKKMRAMENSDLTRGSIAKKLVLFYSADNTR
jgi:hypothetical protein